MSSGPRVKLEDHPSLGSALNALEVVAKRPVMVIVGDAARELPYLVEGARNLLIQRAIVPVCEEEGVIVITGGTDAGVMAELGRLMSEEARCSTNLVGIAPDGRLKEFGAKKKDEEEEDEDAANAEPHHALLVTPGNRWGDEADVLVRTAETLSDGRILMVVLGGGKGTMREVSLALERDWPIILVTGYPGTSDQLSASIKAGSNSVAATATAARASIESVDDVTDGRKDGDGPSGERVTAGASGTRAGAESVDDVTDGRKDDDDPSGERIAAAARRGRVLAVDFRERDWLERELRWNLTGDHLLREAWSRYAAADAAAVKLKPWAEGRLLVAIGLGLVLVFVSIVRVALPPEAPAAVWVLVMALITALPLTAAIVLGIGERIAKFQNWIDLRHAAEAIIREIYRYRSRAKPYGLPSKAPALLVEALKGKDDRVGEQIATPQGDPSVWSPLSLRTPPEDSIPLEDSLLAPLTPSKYDDARACHQLRWMTVRADRTHRLAMWWTVMIYLFAALSTGFLAVAWRDGWAFVVVGAAAALLTAATSWREYQPWDARSGRLRRTALAVRQARAHWLAKSAAKRSDTSALAEYVAAVEDALGDESADWERVVRQAQRGVFSRHGRS